MIYLITGIDNLLIQNKIKEILQNENIDEFDVSKYDAFDKKFDIKPLIQDCNSIPMFSDKKVVYLENPNFLTSAYSMTEKDQELFIEFIKNDGNTFYLFMYGNINTDERKTINKYIKKYIKRINIEKIKPSEFKNITKTILKNNKIEIKNEAFDELMNRLPIDLINLNTEVEKLRILNKVIELEDIKHLISKPLETDIFNLINAIIEKKLFTAIDIWKDLKRLNNDGLGIALILSTQIRFMYQVKYLNNKGYTKIEISKELKAHPYRVELVLKKVYKYSLLDLLNILDQLAKLDQNSKKGKISGNDGFELFLINMTR